MSFICGFSLRRPRRPMLGQVKAANQVQRDRTAPKLATCSNARPLCIRRRKRDPRDTLASYASRLSSGGAKQCYGPNALWPPPTKRLKTMGGWQRRLETSGKVGLVSGSMRTEPSSLFAGEQSSDHSYLAHFLWPVDQRCGAHGHQLCASANFRGLVIARFL